MGCGVSMSGLSYGLKEDTESNQFLFRKSGEIDKNILEEVIDILKEYPTKILTLGNLIKQKDSQFSIAGDAIELDAKIESVKAWLSLIDNALESLPIQHRKIIEYKYLASDEPLDTEVIKKIKIAHNTYYKQKSKAIEKVAKLLGYII